MENCSDNLITSDSIVLGPFGKVRFLNRPRLHGPVIVPHDDYSAISSKYSCDIYMGHNNLGYLVLNDDAAVVQLDIRSEGPAPRT